MTATTLTGPLITAGNMMDGLSGSPQNTAAAAGPNLEYHSAGFLDVRYWPLNKEQTGQPGAIPAFYHDPDCITVNAVPSAVGATLVAAQRATNGTALALVTGPVAGINLNVPYQNFATRATATGGVALDLGIETPTVTASSKTVTVANSSVYRTGQPIIITHVGNAAGTTHLFTYVVTIPTATSITIADTPLASNSTTSRICTGLPGWANLNGATPARRPTVYAPYISGGPGLFYDETQGVERGVKISSTAGPGGAFKLSGADIYGQTQTETITLGSGASSGLSLKTYKMINSVVPAFSDTSGNYSVVTQDLYGFAFRSDFWEFAAVSFGGNAVSSSTGWTAGNQTSPNVNASPRGTYALQTSSQGASRLVIYQNLPFLNVVRSSPDNPSPLFGVTPT